MIDKDLIRQTIEEKLASTDCFLVLLSISGDNQIMVEIDSETSVDLDFCVELTRRQASVSEKYRTQSRGTYRRKQKDTWDARCCR